MFPAEAVGCSDRRSTLSTDGFMLATWTPEKDAAFAAESKRMVADASKAPAAKQDKQVDSAAPVPDKVDGSKAEAVVSDDKGPADKAKAPDGPEAPDLSFLPESVRSKVHFDDDHALGTVKSGFMAHAEATKKFQAASALQRDAENYRFLIGDEDMAAVVAKAMADKKAGRKIGVPAVAPVATDVDPLDPASLAQFVTSTAEKVADEKVAAARTEVQKELDAPTLYRNAMNAAITEYAKANAVETDVMAEAVKLAAADNANVDVFPEDVPRLMGGYVRAARLSKQVTKPVNKPVVGNGHAGTEAVTSPNGRGGSAVANTLTFPAHWVNGRPPRVETDAQAELTMLYAIQKNYGPDVTLEAARTGRFR